MGLEQVKADTHWHAEGRVKACIMCQQTYPLTDFSAYGYTTKQGKRSTRYESRCKECSRARRMTRYKTMTERERAVSLAWKHRNTERIADYNRIRQADPEHRRMKAKHQRLRKARMRAGSGDTPEIRVFYDEAVRIEALIADCPVFDLPELGKKIHVDHVIPLARGGRHEPSNLQLLAAGLNLRKGAQCPR